MGSGWGRTDMPYLAAYMGHSDFRGTQYYYDKKKIMASMRERSAGFIGILNTYLPYYLS
jgi:hypothetical protein